MTIGFATRPSRLARWQTRHVIERFQSRHPGLECQEVLISSRGDESIDQPLPLIGGKGVFTQELEQALLSGQVRAAVHSLKDLPTDMTPGLMIGAILEREEPGDVLISRLGQTLDELDPGSVVGTSSTRRTAQLLAVRPDLQPRSLRGNVDTRLRKLEHGEYDAILLAAAGVIRLGFADRVTQWLAGDLLLPAPGQGALAVQCRSDDSQMRHHLLDIDHPATRLAVTAERAFLQALGGGCSIPVAALAAVSRGGIELRACVLSPDGSQTIRLSGAGPDPQALGAELARQAVERGAASLLAWGTAPA
jgi:hydroxymethylbilane synthase